MLKKYAELATNVGVNLQKGQMLVVNAPIYGAELARNIAAAAYARGAKDVVMVWHDEQFAKIRYVGADQNTLSKFPRWRRDMYMGYAEENAAVITITGDDPDIFRDIDPGKIMCAQKAAGEALLEYRARLMTNKNAWTIIPFATAPWAKKIFPDATESEAVGNLWREIFRAVRLTKDNDPLVAWSEHTKFLQRAARFMNDHAFSKLHYQNEIGTDLTVKLPPGHIWAGGAEFTTTENPVRFVANMPTEEIYTLPLRNGVDGVVHATKPLIHQGKTIRNFWLKFHHGKAVEFAAEEGEEVLRELLSTDEGAKFLGEVALVPYNSPISRSGLLFYNTLFDENASCHLALGKAYPTCLKDGETMDSAELAAHGVNDSLIHVDFMIGSRDLTITGITSTGAEVPVFTQGNFAFSQ